MAEAMTLGGGLRGVVAEYWSNEGSFPATNGIAGVATTVNGKYVTSVVIASGRITATMKSTGVAKGIQGNLVFFRYF